MYECIYIFVPYFYILSLHTSLLFIFVNNNNLTSIVLYIYICMYNLVFADSCILYLI